MNIIRTLRFIINHPLNRHRKMWAVRRWLAWQVGSRLVPGDVAVKFVNGALLLARPGMTGATGNIYTGLHEFEEMSFALHLLRSSDLFVDVGANIGSYTILAGAVVGARCISVEPIPATFRDLLRNIRLNGIGHIVDARNLGIGSEEGRLRFTSDRDTMNRVASEHAADTIEVDVTTLDGLIGQAEPVLIKIDVEGYEAHVIAGGGQVLVKDSLDAVIMEGNYHGSGGSVLHGKMLDHGFRPFTYSPFDRRLVPRKDLQTSSENTLYVRNAGRVLERLASAPEFDVNGIGL